MAKYRKKPVVVEAIQFNGFNVKKIKEFVGDSLVSNWPETVHWIKTLEGNMQISQGDYIIKGVNGEFYPCKPDIFEKTYEKVNDANKTSKLNMTISVKDTEVFQMLLDYTKVLIDIVEKYPLAIEERQQVESIFDNISNEFYEYKRKVQL
nr:hypothetical protein [Neobacillus endophyticus]